MSEAKPAAPARPINKDQWGLRPARPGRLRGRVANLRRGSEVCAFGQLLVFEFDLVTDPAQPPVPVRMSGTILNRDIHEGLVVDVRDPTPAVRPLETSRLLFPGRNDAVIHAFYPGRDDPSPARQRLLGMLAVIGPALVGAGLLAIYFVYGR